jgi:crotonobetainyl-CoA:carnitine CoA-transferase CaiB-like acyl-CoA transferase
VEIADPQGGTTTMINTPVDFAVHESRPRAVAPELGQHTDEVLAELPRRRGQQQRGG